MPTRLLFSNLPFDCSDETLKGWIEHRGYPVASVKVIRDIVSGTSPSFAQVQLTGARIEEAEQALNGQSLRGRSVHVTRVVAAANASGRTFSTGLGNR